jgi:hypothetical protein
LFSFLLFAVEMLAISGYLLSIDQPTDGAPDMADKEDDAPPLLLIDGGKPDPANIEKPNKKDGVKGRNGLTNKQRAFVRAMLNGAGSQSAAYREAYDAEDMSDKAIHTEASKLMLHPTVSRSLEEGFAAQDAAALHSGASLRGYVEKQLYEMTSKADSDANKLKALHLLGQTERCGIFSTKMEITNVDAMTEEEVTTELEAQLKAAFNQ